METRQYLNGALYVVQTDVMGPSSRHTVLRRHRGRAVQTWVYGPRTELDIKNGVQYPDVYTYSAH